MLLRPEQMQGALLRIESDLYELHPIVGQTVSNQAKLTDTVVTLAERHDALTATVVTLAATMDRMSDRVDTLAATVDRYIRAQGEGHHGNPNPI